MSETSDSEDVSNQSEFHTPQQQAAAQDRENWSEWDETRTLRLFLVTVTSPRLSLARSLVTPATHPHEWTL